MKEGNSHPLEQNPFYIHWLLLTGIAVFSAAVFVVDIFIPLGVSGGVVYVLLVMATYWTKGRKITTSIGVLATLLIIAGFYFSVSSDYFMLSGVNHVMTIIIVWASVWFVNNYKESIIQLRKNYRTLFKVTTDEILVFQLNASQQPEPFLEVNDTACTILGYSHDELLQKSLYDIVAFDKEKTNKQIKEVVDKGEAVLESYHRTKEGDIIPMELSVRLFAYNNRKTLISVGRDLRDRRRLEREILNISESERLRIGQEMHDNLGQLLAVAKMTAQQLEVKMKSKKMQEAEELHEVVSLVGKAGESARTIAHGLIPVHMESVGLVAALQELTSSISKLYGTNIHHHGELDDQSIDTPTAMQMYRIAQEAIHNAVKHAQATSIEVKLSSSDDYILMRIRDNGTGFNPEAKGIGRGLRIMKFRSNTIGADLKINSKEGEGTEIICRIDSKVNT